MIGCCFATVPSLICTVSEQLSNLLDLLSNKVSDKVSSLQIVSDEDTSELLFFMALLHNVFVVSGIISVTEDVVLSRELETKEPD